MSFQKCQAVSIPKLLTQSSNSVSNLTDRKIRWIIREKMKEILSTNDIALLQNVSGSRIRQIWRYYRITKTTPILEKPGRPSRSDRASPGMHEPRRYSLTTANDYGIIL